LDVEPVKSFGKVIDHYRSICVEIVPGRHAVLSKSDRQEFFEILLQQVGRAFYRHELDLVLRFVGVADPDSVELYCNPPDRYVAHPPPDKELEYWLRRVGYPYPYAGDA
jgi:hypothetical protein